ncbi:hypothetical protein [Arthrobacter sp. 2MCAF14]|uniref:hypothetical protein n=1 Tax=Arthrobacter sp. 2MCAF14 TaxID=3232982 RepID=UPI003F914F6F
MIALHTRLKPGAEQDYADAHAGIPGSRTRVRRSGGPGPPGDDGGPGPASGPRPYARLGPQHGGLFRSFGVAEARETLDTAGVGGAVLVQADDTVADTESMLAVADRNPWVLGVVGWIPRSGKGAGAVPREVRW